MHNTSVKDVEKNFIAGVTVIVCCYNSSNRLPETIKHIAGQIVPDSIGWELIVIDNASTDDTAKVASSEWAKYDIRNVKFTITEELQSGLRYAREKGLRSASYEYVIFCDDDNWLCPEYVSVAFRVMDNDDEIGVLGGCGIFEPEQPMWPEIEKHKASYVNGEQTWAETQHWVYGAGCVYRKSVLLDFYDQGWQQITVGREGSKLSAGEDVEICFMYFLNGYKIKADNRLKFRHFVPINRQNVDYLVNMAYWISYTNVILNPYYHLMAKSATPISHSLLRWCKQAKNNLLKRKLRLFYNQIRYLRSLTLEEKKSLAATRATFDALKQKRGQLIWQYDHVAELISKMKIPTHG